MSGGGNGVGPLDVATRYLAGTGRALEASVRLLPDSLGPGERDLAREALCEASAILCDAAKRLRAPLPPVDMED